MRRGQARPIGAVALVGAIGLLFALQLWCFHWGVITPDTVDQYAQIRSGVYEDWHPPITTWLWKQLGRFGGGTAPVLVFDCALYWLAFGLIADRLRRLGHPVAAALAIAVAALPIPFGQMGAILKDPLMAACLVAATGLIGLGAVGGGRVPIAARVAGIALIVFAGAMRFNAVFAAAPLLLLAFGGGRSARGAIFGLIGCVLLLAGASWAINKGALHARATQPIISLVQFDMAGIAVRSDTSIYPADMRPDAALVARCYAPDQFNRANIDACNDTSDALLDDINRTPHGLETIWLGAIARHPLAYFEHRLAHFNWNQRWLIRQVPRDAVYVASQPNDLGLAFHEGPGAARVFALAQATAQSPLGRPATWTAVAIALLILAPHLASRALVTALGGSALLYALAYGAVSVAPDLRYNLWTMLAAMIGLLVALVELPRTAAARRDALLAAVPVAIVVAGELVAMAGA